MGDFSPIIQRGYPTQAYSLETSIPTCPSWASAPRLQVAQYIKKMRSKAVQPSPLGELLYESLQFLGLGMLGIFA